MRLIDADALKDNMRFRGGMVDDNHLLHVPWADVSKSIDNAPAVDAVPVVRCKDCKHLKSVFCPLVMADGYYVPASGPAFFCAEGERQESE